MLLLAEEMMRECHTKIMNGRIRDPEKDRARQGYFNSFSSLMNAYRHMLEDMELEEIEQELEEIKAERPFEISTDS